MIQPQPLQQKRPTPALAGSCSQQQEQVWHLSLTQGHHQRPLKAPRSETAEQGSQQVAMAEPIEVLSACHPFPQPRSTPSSLAGHRGGNGDLLRGTSSSAVLVAAALVIYSSSRGWAHWVPHPNPDGESDGRVWADWKVGPRRAQLVQTMLASAVI